MSFCHGLHLPTTAVRLLSLLKSLTSGNNNLVMQEQDQLKFMGGDFGCSAYSYRKCI
uniref:Uncharacterized protein n=1 Tax=Rhizophora mucronata TaxID=61149 RepID=A0A2P2KWG4_RHIMU